MTQPLTVAVIGSSPDRRKFGNKSVRAHRAAGYTVYPIHPTASLVESLTVYRSIREVPISPLNRVTIYVPPAIGLQLLPEIASVSPGEVWFNPGTDSEEVLLRAHELGLRVIAGCSIVDLGFSPAQFPDE